ncbi:MAG: SPOR domain-containing protein [Pararhodobacter sp.]|nr:SPOR domain-containing protein [Pararhodobacter sp.]
MARAVSGVQAPFPVIRRFAGVLFGGVAALGLLAGCSQTDVGEGASRAAVSSDLTRGSARVIERDVEAPEVFSIEETGLWDGRPSLGGVWVAHPEASDPERVMIRNAQTGETVVGALFRRERENPGPRFQISSEAANALGILPGQPTTIRVVALQLQQIEPDPEPRQERAEQPAADAAPEEAGEERAGDTATGDARDSDEVAEATGNAEQTEMHERPSGLRGLFSRRDPAPAGAASPEIAMTSLPEPGQTEQPHAMARTDGQAEPPARERRGLSRLFGRSERNDEPEPQSAALIPIPEDAPESRPEAASAPAASALDRPFVQIGIFSVESNAQGARERMQQAGLSAEIRRGRMGDNQFWRVVVGPAQDRAGQAAVLDRVREMGFGDAYAVAR